MITIIFIICIILYIVFRNRNEKFTTANSNIPKIIHLCYKTKNIPNFIIKNWTKLNPDYKVILYDNNDCIDFLYKHFGQKHVDIFNYIEDGPIKADFWRVCILYIYGGVYCDIDVEPLVPIESFMEKNIDFLTCISMTKDQMNPHLIITYPGNIILKQSIDRYIEMFDTKYNYSYWRWSIVYVMSDILYTFFGEYINTEGIYTQGMKIQLIKEIYKNRLEDVYCVYKNKRILNNRYADYDSINHIFDKNKDKNTSIIIKLFNKFKKLIKM